MAGGAGKLLAVVFVSILAVGAWAFAGPLALAPPGEGTVRVGGDSVEPGPDGLPPSHELPGLSDDADPPLVEASESLSPGYGPCPGAPPPGGGMQRRPDSVRDANGDRHMVWQEPDDGNFEICYYARQGELGVGSDRNLAVRITNSPSDSVAPHIAIDAASEIAYVVWTEEIEQHSDGVVPVDSGLVSPVLLYTATALFEPGAPMWTRPQALAGAGTLRQFFVAESRYTGILLQQGRVQTDRDWNGEFDTDRDGIKDGDEVLAVLGYRTLWWKADTDDDRIPDLIEIQNVFDPIIPVEKEFPQCFPRGQGKICDLIFNLLCFVVDLDGDGFTLCGEGQDFPVTTEVAGFTHGGSATYRFWPKVDGTYNLVMRTEMRTYSTAVACTSVSVAITADGVSVGTWTRPWDDTNPPWTAEVAATFNVSGIDFAAVTASQAVDVALTVSFDPPACGDAILAVFRHLALDWLKLELASDRSEVNYKDADDFTNSPPPPSFLVDVDTEDMVIHLDGAQKDLLLELDSMAGHNWDPKVLNEAINTYSDHNIILNYKVSETGLPLSEVVKAGAGDVSEMHYDWPVTSTDETSLYLQAHRDMSLQALRYVHVMNVHRGDCGVAEQGVVGDAPALSGVMLFDQDFIDDFCGLGTVADGISSLFTIRLLALVHELGHVFNTAHEKTTGTVSPVIDPGGFDTCNAYNLMVGGGYCIVLSLFAKEMTGVGNTDRRFGATSPIAGPRYSIETIAQMDLTSLLTVETTNNLTLLGLYV